MRFLILTLFPIVILTPIAHGQSPVSTDPTPYSKPVSTNPAETLINPLNTGGANCSTTGTCVSAFLANILALVVKIGTVVVILMLVYVGYLFVVAQGSDSKITEARKALLWTLVGALILLGAQGIAKGIEATVQAISAGK